MLFELIVGCALHVAPDQAKPDQVADCCCRRAPVQKIVKTAAKLPAKATKPGRCRRAARRC